jgi:hypothetical protein
MYHIPLPLTDAVLLLTPPWSEQAGIAQAGFFVLLALVPAALALLYRSELRLIERSIAWVLLSVRLAVLLAVLFVLCGQPIVAWTATEELPGRILVAVDRSQSMDVADPGRGDGLTRTQLGEKLLSPDGLGLLKAIGRKHRADLLGFAMEAWEGKADQVNEFYRRGLEAGAPANSPLAGTDLGLPLRYALKHSGAAPDKILGIVLLTDGRHNWGPSPVATADELCRQQMPIYPIPLGARAPPPDVALVSVKAPPAVFKDADVQIEARFRVTGLPRQDLNVELQRPCRPPLVERIAHDGIDRFHTVRFVMRLNQVGTQAMTLAARPVAGEIHTDNNSRPVVINVADDKARVLLIDGEARWEYQYLANALARDPTVRLDRVVFAQPRLGYFSDEELKTTNYPSQTLLSGTDALARYDCIILGDVIPEQFPMADRIRVERFVADRGGTLVILAGKRAMPLAFAQPEAAPADPLLKLLPIMEPRAVHPVRGFAVTLTYDGRLAPFLQMDAAPDKSLDQWSALPPHYWGIVGRAKPGASALAYFRNDQAGEDKAFAENEQALIARHHYGFGRVLFVGLDSTWRWRYKVGDTHHHRFWGQVIRWAATDKPLVAGNHHVRFGTPEPTYQQGQEIELVVRLADEVAPLAPAALAGARVLHQAADGKLEAVALVPLTRRDGQCRLLEGRIRDVPAGQYTVELVIPEIAERTANLRAGFTVTPTDNGELSDLSANWPLLEELAAKSGGKLFPPERAAELAELLDGRSVTRSYQTESRLWEWWPTLAVVLLLLGVEWITRKWAGLP